MNKDILSIIASFIKEPKDFYNFSLANKTTFKISKQLKEVKEKEFYGVRKIIEKDRRIVNPCKGIIHEDEPICGPHYVFVETYGGRILGPTCLGNSVCLAYTYKLLNQEIPEHLKYQIKFIDQYIDLYNKDYIKKGYVFLKN